MRAPSVAWTSWKWTVLDSTAEWTLIGTLTRPKLIVPFQIDFIAGRITRPAVGARPPPRGAACAPRRGRPSAPRSGSTAAGECARSGEREGGAHGPSGDC